MPDQTPPDSGPRPRPTGAPPSPSGPPDPAPPKRLRAVDDPVKLARAGHILAVALAREGLTYADLEAPATEHARAA